MGSYRFNGFRSRARDSGTEKGLVLQSETSRKSNVANSSSSPALFSILFVIFEFGACSNNNSVCNSRNREKEAFTLN
jgi:hypothetical protein